MMSKLPTKYTLKIFLYEVSPQIWRRFTISGDSSFSELHEIIQLAMGWENKESHEFRYGKGRNLTNVIASKDEDIAVEGDFHDESELTVDGFFNRRRLPFRMLYRYDFLEDWVHELVFEKKEVMDSDQKILAKLIEGERACPPEDCGGTWGYMSALEGEVEWMDDEYNPDDFDVTAISLEID